MKRTSSLSVNLIRRYRLLILAVTITLTTISINLSFNQRNVPCDYEIIKNIFTERLIQWKSRLNIYRITPPSDKVILTQKPTTVESIGDWKVIKDVSSTEQCGGVYKTNRFTTTIQTSIKEGAKFIYLSSECDQSTLHYLQRFELSNMMSILKYTGNATQPLVNHFITVNGTNSKRNLKEMAYNLGVWKTALIHKILFRNEIHSKGEIDPRAPPAVLNQNIHFIRDKVLFHYDAFWALAPIENDEAWSMWVQRLLRELDSWVAFLTVSPVHHHCPTGSKKINQLDKWKCENKTSFFACIKSLSTFMVKYKLLDTTNNEVINSWLKMLSDIGYKEPKIDSKNTLQQGLVYRTLYHPKIDSLLFTMNRSYQDICGKSPIKCPEANVKKSTNKISSILVTVVYNRESFYDIVTYIENIYRPHFTYIAFCGLVMDKFLRFAESMKARVTFVEMDAKEFLKGQHGHKCIEAGMKLNYDVEGTMHINDDVLLNVWNLQNLPLDRVWFQKALKMTPFSQATVPDVWEKRAKAGGKWWSWTSKEMGKLKLKKAIHSVRQLYESHPLAKEYIDQVDENTGGKAMGFHGVSDIAYFPAATFKRYLYAAEIFSPYGVMLELEIPSLIGGITNLKDILVLNGSYIWYGERDKFTEYYNPSHIFLHALKIANCLKDKACVGFLCDRYLPCL